MCSTCVQGTNYITRNTLQNIHTKFCIGSSSRRGFFPAGVCLPDQTGLTGPVDQSDRSKQSQQSQVLKFEEKPIHPL